MCYFFYFVGSFFKHQIFLQDQFKRLTQNINTYWLVWNKCVSTNFKEYKGPLVNKGN